MNAHIHPTGGTSSNRWFYLVIGMIIALVVLAVVLYILVAGVTAHHSGSLAELYLFA